MLFILYACGFMSRIRFSLHFPRFFFYRYYMKRSNMNDDPMTALDNRRTRLHEILIGLRTDKIKFKGIENLLKAFYH
jgi:hypothetical protein